MVLGAEVSEQSQFSTTRPRISNRLFRGVGTWEGGAAYLIQQTFPWSRNLVRGSRLPYPTLSCRVGTSGGQLTLSRQSRAINSAVSCSTTVWTGSDGNQGEEQVFTERPILSHLNHAPGGGSSVPHHLLWGRLWVLPGVGVSLYHKKVPPPF